MSSFHAAAFNGCGTLIPSLPPLDPGILFSQKRLRSQRETTGENEAQAKVQGI
jgi:hypothetical protein